MAFSFLSFFIVTVTNCWTRDDFEMPYLTSFGTVSDITNGLGSWYHISINYRSENILETRMHSGRMCTACLLTVSLFLEGGLPTPPGCRPLLEADPLKIDPPRYRPRWMHTPYGQKEWHTPAKILPCSKLHLQAVMSQLALLFHTTLRLLWIYYNVFV